MVSRLMQNIGGHTDNRKIETVVTKMTVYTENRMITETRRGRPTIREMPQLWACTG
jgi:hypothetical protein